MLTPVYTGIKLACGCIPPVYMCKESLRLWNEVVRLHELAKLNTNIEPGAAGVNSWKIYDEALVRYCEHYQKRCEERRKMIFPQTLNTRIPNEGVRSKTFVFSSNNVNLTKNLEDMKKAHGEKFVKDII